MTREENLHWIDEEIRTWENECQSKHPIKEALYAARRALEQEPRWIPVTERLPEEGTFVLASYNSDEGVDVIMTYYNKYGFTRGLMTAWMPLPEPYKGGQEE